MPRIKNKLFQPLTIMAGEGKTLYLQAREEAVVGKDDLDAPHLRSMVSRGDIAVIDGEKEPGPKKTIDAVRKPEAESRAQDR